VRGGLLEKKNSGKVESAKARRAGNGREELSKGPIKIKEPLELPRRELKRKIS